MLKFLEENVFLLYLQSLIDADMRTLCTDRPTNISIYYSFVHHAQVNTSMWVALSYSAKISD